MMKRLSFAIFLVVIYATSCLYGQTISDVSGMPVFASELCYTESMQRTIKVVEELNTSTLSIQDKLVFKPKEYSKNHHHYFDSQGDAIHDVTTISQKNIYPQWYNYARLIRKSSSGAQSHFDTNSQFHVGGWLGASKNSTSHGQYVSDKRTREHYYEQPHTTLSQAKYDRHNGVSGTYGFLYRYVWRMPTSQILQSFQTSGYTVNSSASSGMLTVSNSEHVLLWDQTNKVHVIQQLSNGEVVATTRFKYLPSSAIGEDLLYQTIEEVPLVFSNGDCYTSVTTISHEDYVLCGEQTISRPVLEEGAPAEILATSFAEGGYTLSPNPVSELMTVTLPSQVHESKLLVTDANGRLMLQRKVVGGITSLQINTVDFPTGVYVIKIASGSSIFSSKFVKQ